MGIPFSNSEEAALRFVEKCNLGEVVMVPLMCSENVVEALEHKEIDLGVVAVKNAIAGTVIETEIALNKRDTIETVEDVNVPIHHYLYIKHPDCKICAIASHVQALLQCKNNLVKLCPETEKIEVADTAYAAEMLAAGSLSDEVAVVCRKEAGDHYGLTLLKENIEDDERNMTAFSLIRLKN
jgi:Prephenate dehydratase